MPRCRLAISVLALIFATALVAGSEGVRTPRSRIEGVVRRYYAEVAEEGDQAKAAGFLDALLSKDFLFTFGNGDESSRGIAAHKQFLAWHHRVGTDQVWTIENLVIDGDSAAVRFRLRLISADTVSGIPATGKPVLTRGMDLFRFSDGRIIELYRVFDARDVFRQLGVPCPPEPPKGGQKQ